MDDKEQCYYTNTCKGTLWNFVWYTRCHIVVFWI